MSISIEELNRMSPDSYQIIDIRDETEIGQQLLWQQRRLREMRK